MHEQLDCVDQYNTDKADGTNSSNVIFCLLVGLLMAFIEAPRSVKGTTLGYVYG